MTGTKLVIMGENYADDQVGYKQAFIDGAVHTVSIDEQSYTSMYNVQVAIGAVCDCIGSVVSVGLVNNDEYVSLAFAEDTAASFWQEYSDLDEAFIQGKAIRLQGLRDNVDGALDDLAEALGECEERKTIDHCTDCIEDQRKSLNNQ